MGIKTQRELRERERERERESMTFKPQFQAVEPWSQPTALPLSLQVIFLGEIGTQFTATNNVLKIIIGRTINNSLKPTKMDGFTLVKNVVKLTRNYKGRRKLHYGSIENLETDYNKISPGTICTDGRTG